MVKTTMGFRLRNSPLNQSCMKLPNYWSNKLETEWSSGLGHMLCRQDCFGMFWVFSGLQLCCFQKRPVSSTVTTVSQSILISWLSWILPYFLWINYELTYNSFLLLALPEMMKLHFLAIHVAKLFSDKGVTVESTYTGIQVQPGTVRRSKKP